MAQDTPRGVLSLVLRSKKALDHTKTLCLHADVLSKESTQLALNVCAVDAKVRWASEMIMEQIKVWRCSGDI
jgi:autophagy-related protein 17